MSDEEKIEKIEEKVDELERSVDELADAVRENIQLKKMLYECDCDE